jgi:hypothetical protein
VLLFNDSSIKNSKPEVVTKSKNQQPTLDLKGQESFHFKKPCIPYPPNNKESREK